MAHKRTHEMGRGGVCTCPKCETKIPHKRGVPCIKTICPECGAKMLRVDSEHHKSFLNKKKK